MAAAEGIYVDHASLSDLVQELSNHVGRMEARLDLLLRDLAPLASGFRGVARQAQADAQVRWNTEFAGIREVLQQAAAAVASAHQGYRDADAYGAGLFDALG